MRVAPLLVVGALGFAACGGQGPASSVTAAPASPSAPATGATAAQSGASARSTPPPLAPKAPPDTASVYARLQPGLTACYEQGRKTTPEMVEGKLTLNATVEASGRPSCVLASEDSGLTQEVEDCMAARLAAETFDPAASAWTTIVPVVVRKGALQLAERTASQLLVETVETRNMPDAFEALEALLPALQTCLRAVDRKSGVRSVFVGARIGADGRAQCALANGFSALPPEIAECAAAVLRNARFPAPKRGGGVVLVPINLTSR